jgi:putative ABC transport system permease protein
MDLRALGFCLAFSLASAALFGLYPAWRLASAAPAVLLGGGARGATAGREHRRMREGLIVAEIALAMVLLFGAGLLVRTLASLLGTDPGFATERRAAVQVFLWDRNPTAEQRRTRAGALLESLRSTPGVDDAALVTALPFHPHQIASQSRFEVQGRPAATGDEAKVFTTAASPGYFEVMDIRLLRGRAFAEADRAEAPPVAVVNEALARRFFGRENPVGQKVTVGVMGPPLTREIVGVVRDVRPTALDSDPRPELYIPYAQSSTGSVTLVARTRGDAGAMLPSLSRAVWRVDPLQTIYHSGTVAAMVGETLRARWFYLGLLGTFAAAALVLAAVGLGGLISYGVARRRREIGVRLALGERPARLVRSLAGEGLRLAAAGVVLGLAGALAASGALRAMLVGVGPHDPVSALAIAALLCAVSWLAAWLPARAASRVDPVVALRAE